MHLYIITFLFKCDWLLPKETYSVSVYMCPPSTHKMLVAYGKFLTGVYAVVCLILHHLAFYFCM